MVIQVAVLAAVQAHPVPAVTLNEEVPPEEVKFRFPGAIEYVHEAPASVTVKA
jgi:hypothetical protein